VKKITGEEIKRKMKIEDVNFSDILKREMSYSSLHVLAENEEIAVKVTKYGVIFLLLLV
jgi:hypothetical protein